MEQTRLSVEWVAIERVHGSPANPRLNDDAVPHVAASLRRFGWQQPIVARPSGEVIAGNTRLKAAHSLKITEVPVVWFDGSDLEATAYQIADNRSSEFAEWDEPSLVRLLEGLREEDALDGVGFEPEDIDALLAELEKDMEGADLTDAGPEEPTEEPVTSTGDLWVLGDHRILCGDSTNGDDVARLMAGKKARLLATDPPYLVDYKGTGKSAETEAGASHWDDFEGAEEGLAFFTGWLRAALAHCVPDVPVYQWHAHKRQSLVERAWTEAGLLLHQQIIWVKARGVFGRSHFLWAHEVCFYGWPKGKMPKKSRRPPTNGSTVWEISQKGEQDGIHPTQKPTEIFERPIACHTLRGELVLEPFSGSGTQIIAAEKLGRGCRAMEISPAFVDVAVKRWQEATGKDAVLDGTSETFADVSAKRRAA